MFTELWKHTTSSHGEGSYESSDPEEVFINVLIAQQNSILEQITKSEARWDKRFEHLKSSQDNIYKEVKALKTTTLDSKKKGP